MSKIVKFFFLSLGETKSNETNVGAMVVVVFFKVIEARKKSAKRRLSSPGCHLGKVSGPNCHNTFDLGHLSLK